MRDVSSFYFAVAYAGNSLCGPLTGANKTPGLEPLSMAKIEKTSPHRGIDFDDFLKEQGVFEEVMSSPKIKKTIRNLGDLIQAGEREAFAAGWNAFVARHPGFLISHSIADTRIGLEQAWEKYWKSRKEK